ncbi:MAG: tetratricopeptide repeat protein [Bacteroidales bacterium]|nr:tetratricopeptide repeat protein [Bacteroidales bacterium]
MHKYLIKIFGLLFIIVAFSNCSTTKINAKKNTPEVNRYQLTNIFLTAKRDLLKGNRSSAIQGFEKCIKLNENHDASYYELARIYEFENPQLSEEYVKRAIIIDDNNTWYKEFLIQLYKDQHNYSDALKINKELIALQPNNKNYYYQRANLYIHNKDNKNARKTYDDIIELFGYEQGVLEQKKQIYLSNGEFDKAILVLEELIKHNPKEKSYYGMVAELYLNMGDNDNAMRYYQKILEIDPNDGYVHFALADYYKSIGEDQKSFYELKEGMRSKSLNVDSKMKVLLHFQEISTKDKTLIPAFEELLSIATKVNNNEPKILALNADYNTANGNSEKAIYYFERIIAIDSSKFIIWEQLLIAENNIANTEALLNYSNRALKLFPQKASLYFYNGTANADLGNWKRVKQLAIIGDNFIYKKDEKALMLSLRAKAEMHLGEIDNGIANYNSAIGFDSQNTEIQLDYAYYLALNKRNTSRAVAMAKSALELNGNNPRYIYVYAYCLYKDGQSAEAMKWIKPALKKYPDSKPLNLLDMEINKE